MRGARSFGGRAFVVAALLLTATASPAQPTATARARAHFQAGRMAYTSGDYQTAIREFEAAARFLPSPLLTYNIARARERRGDWREAATLYRRYLQELPLAEDRVEVSGRVQELEQLAARLAPRAAVQALPQLRESPSARHTILAVPGPSPAAVVDVPPTRLRRLRWTWVAASTTLAAVVGASTSAGLFVTRRSDMRGGCAQTEAGCSAGAVDGLQTRATAANALWGLAAAAAVTSRPMTPGSEGRRWARGTAFTTRRWWSGPSRSGSARWRRRTGSTARPSRGAVGATLAGCASPWSPTVGPRP